MKYSTVSMPSKRKGMIRLLPIWLKYVLFPWNEGFNYRMMFYLLEKKASTTERRFISLKRRIQLQKDVLSPWKEDLNSLLNKEVAHLRTEPPLGQWRVGAPPIRDWPAHLSTNQRAVARSRGGPANRGQERPFSSTRALTKSTGHWAIYKAWNILNYISNAGALSAKNTISSWFQAKAFPRAFWT